MVKMNPLFGSFLAFLVCATSATYTSDKHAQCRCFPGDECWPSEREWKAFNATVGGQLIKTIPLGSPCHAPNYDNATCTELASQWRLAPVHINSSSSVQAAIFANASCDPFTPQSSPCLLGNYVDYVVNVTGPGDIAATIRFAREKNIRLVVRNTGHDYVGRSTGAGGLAIWTHYLKGVEIKDWSDDDYQGKAVKIGAGAQGFEILDVASVAGLVVVTGECPTVGIGGGYTMSGGHSPLSTAFGLSADNTLEFEIVTPKGDFVRASAFSNHSDLFWALSGAGSGNYGVVTSITLRAHPDEITSGASFTIDQPGVDYAAVLNAWHEALPGVIDSGTQVTYLATSSYTTIHSISGYNHTQKQVEDALQPFIKSMAAMDINLKPNFTTFPSYHDHYLHYFGPLPAGVFGGAGEQLMGGRLLLRNALPNVGSAINETMNLGVQFIGQALNVSSFATPSKRAVLPQWRDAVVMSAYSLPYSLTDPFSEMVARQDYITNTIMPIIESATPKAGAYINEADFQQPDWQDVFFGENYSKLLAVKKKYDPEGLFWNKIAVGSEAWSVQLDGKLCRR